jgi:hypothetical protein
MTTSTSDRTTTARSSQEVISHLTIRPEHLFRHVVAPAIGGAEVAEGDLGGLVTGLVHQLGEAGAQRVPGVAFRIEPGIQGGLLDQPGNRLVGERLPGDLASLGDGQNSGRSAREAALAVQSGSGAPRRCAIQRARAAAGQKSGWSGLAQAAMSCPWPCWSSPDRWIDLCGWCAG